MAAATSLPHPRVGEVGRGLSEVYHHPFMAIKLAENDDNPLELTVPHFQTHPSL